MEEIIDKIVGLNGGIQAFLIFLSTFVSEDLTIIATTSLYFQDLITKLVYYVGLGGGIVLSDIGVFILGRFFGNKCDRFLFLDFKKIREKAEEFKTQGFLFLIYTRFTPGFRFPSMFAAGVSGYSFKLFTLAKIISVVILITFIELLGNLFLKFLSNNKQALFFTALFLLILFVSFFKIKHSGGFRVFYYSIIKYRYFEFWPAWFFYFPTIIYYILLGLKNRDILLPIYANPAIKHGGLIGESKADLQKLQDKNSDYYLQTILIKKSLSVLEKLSLLNSFIEAENLTYPIIIKPDVGQRGAGVTKVKNQDEALEHLEAINYDVIAQEFCDYPEEMGVFYYLDTKTQKPKIFSITLKNLPKIYGDGSSNLKELILADKRARYIAKTYLKRFKNAEIFIPQEDEEVLLVNAGNHAQGAIFKDGNHLINEKLISIIADNLSNIDGFYIGRVDVKYEGGQSLKDGQNFKIIEINGSGSESTNIYDVKYNVFYAYKILFQQWSLIFKRAKLNKNSQEKYSMKEFLRDYFSYLKTSKNYKSSS